MYVPNVCLNDLFSFPELLECSCALCMSSFSFSLWVTVYMSLWSLLRIGILQLLKEKGLIPELSLQVQNIVCALDVDLQGPAATVASLLRGKGQSVDLVLESKPLKWYDSILLLRYRFLRQLLIFMEMLSYIFISILLQGFQTSCTNKCRPADIGGKFRVAKGYGWCENSLFCRTV